MKWGESGEENLEVTTNKPNEIWSLIRRGAASACGSFIWVFHIETNTISATGLPVKVGEELIPPDPCMPAGPYLGADADMLDLCQRDTQDGLPGDTLPIV